MILAIDAGNTNITFGIYDNKKLKTSFRITTKLPRTSDEFGMTVRDLLSMNDIPAEEIEGVIIASVVPNIMHALTGAMVKYIKKTPLIVGSGIKTGIRVTTENPKAIGADRIADAVAAYEKYGGPVLVVAFGTGTTYDLVSENGSFVAGITAPGMQVSLNALSQEAAKLPEVEIVKPKSILAQETISSMQAGLVYGQIGQTEYIIRQVKKETGYQDLKVVATGGLGRMISEETDAINIYDSSLTLDGLRMIYDKNRK